MITYRLCHLIKMTSNNYYSIHTVGVSPLQEDTIPHTTFYTLGDAMHTLSNTNYHINIGTFDSLAVIQLSVISQLDENIIWLNKYQFKCAV